MRTALRVLAAVVSALCVLLVVLLQAEDGGSDANIGAGLVALLLSVLGLPWAAAIWIWDPDVQPGWAPYGLAVSGAVLNVLILALIVRRRRKPAA